MEPLFILAILADAFNRMIVDFVSILLNDGMAIGMGFSNDIGLTSLKPVFRENERMQPSREEKEDVL